MKIKTAKAQWAVEFVDIAKASQIDGAEWEPFQVSYLNCETRFAIWTKSRQAAFSFTSALDAIANSEFTKGATYAFVSLNMEESKNKIKYAQRIVAATKAHARPEIVANSLTKLTLINNQGHENYLVSRPCKEVRGATKGHIYLDEWAHYLISLQSSIYRSAVPATTAGGYIRGGSSPNAEEGMFWDIASSASKAWGVKEGGSFRKFVVPWWGVSHLCKDVVEAMKIAPSMPTADRVELFGRDKLKEIYHGMFLEDFQVEFECAWMVLGNSYISWETIRANQEVHKGDYYHWQTKEDVDNHFTRFKAQAADEKYSGIETSFLMGIDIGRYKDLTEIILLGINGDRYPVRLQISLKNWHFDDQRELVNRLLAELNIIYCAIDKTGMGSDMADHFERKYEGTVEGVTFTNQSKERMVVNGRRLAEQLKTPLPLSKTLAYQIHSIKKSATQGGNRVKFESSGQEHHADQFWAWVLALKYTHENHESQSENNSGFTEGIPIEDELGEYGFTQYD